MYFKSVISVLVLGVVCIQSLVLGAPSRRIGSNPKLTNAAEDQIKFYLFTKTHKTTHLRIYTDSCTNLEYMNFDLPIIMLIHGFGSDITTEMIQGIKDQILTYYDVNVIGVDWGVLAETIFYDKAANATELVGRLSAELLDHLITKGAKRELMHVVGHSLGAQAAGFTGAFFKAGKLPRVTGLDPARPSFINTTNRINPNDADFVDCVHTCGGILGLKEPVCHADYYVNSGTDPQPGCETEIDFGLCSHERAYLFYAESVIPSHKFNADSCDGHPTEENTNCTQSEALMGFPATSNFQGIFHVTTNRDVPYSKNITS